jgi:F1F0 ATPase subunit 2
MTWLTAVTTGAGAGLAYFGGLWLTVRMVLSTPQRRWLLPASSITRLTLVGVTFYALSQTGAGHAVAGLVGVLIARRWVMSRAGEVAHAR